MRKKCFVDDVVLLHVCSYHFAFVCVKYTQYYIMRIRRERAFV